jgi:hypothetical protein
MRGCAVLVCGATEIDEQTIERYKIIPKEEYITTEREKFVAYLEVLSRY